MEENWERRNKFITLDLEQLTSLIQPIFPQKKVCQAQLLTNGKINTNYKIEVSSYSEPFVLRIYARNPEACRKDLDLFRLIRRKIPCPEIIYADEKGKHIGYPYAISKWIDGILMKDLFSQKDLSPQIAQNIARSTGEELAKIHSFSFSQAGFFGPNLILKDPFESFSKAILHYFETCLSEGYAPRRLGATNANHLLQFVQENIDCLQELEEKFSLVHADFKATNILVHQVSSSPWKISAILDWEFAFAGSSVFDIGQMLRHESQLPPNFENEFIASFIRYGGFLPKEWKKAAKLLDLLNLCSFLDDSSERKVLFQEVEALIYQTMENWPQYQSP